MIWSAKCTIYTILPTEHVTEIYLKKSVWMSVPRSCLSLFPLQRNTRKSFQTYIFNNNNHHIVLIICINFTFVYVNVHVQLLSGWIANLMLNNHVIFITYLDIWKYADVFSLTTLMYVQRVRTKVQLMKLRGIVQLLHVVVVDRLL